MAVAAVDAGANMQKIIDIPIRERIGRIKYVAEADVQANMTHPGRASEAN